MQMKLSETHVLHGWAIVHAGWLLTRYHHLSSSIGITVFMGVKGRPYRGRVCFLVRRCTAWTVCSWRRGCWLTKDGSVSMPIIAVGSHEVIRSKAVRKIAEHWDASLLLSLEVGPWDLKTRGPTLLQHVKPSEQQIPLLHVSADGVEAERDADERAVLKNARKHPDEDRDGAIGDFQAGRADPLQTHDAPHELQAGGEVPMLNDSEMAEMMEPTFKRDRESELRLSVPVRQRVADAEAVKRSSAQILSQTKFVKFDHTVSEQQKSKQPKTEMFNPTFAGEISSSPVSGGASDSGHVRRVIEEIELYEEDEPEEVAPLEFWDWNMNDQLLDGDFSQHKLSDEEKQMRGFKNEDAGPPEVSAAEFAFLDKQAMYAELERLRKSDVIGDVQAGVDVTQALYWTPSWYVTGVFAKVVGRDVQGWSHVSFVDAMPLQRKFSVQPLL